MKGFAPQEWKPFKRVPNAKAIAESLKQIPSHWSLTPLQDKSPKRLNWQSEGFIPHATIRDLILNGEAKISKAGNNYTQYWSGYGLRTGEASGGIIAIDVDGESAKPLLEAISGGDIPHTVSWTSSKPGRYQLAFQIPDEVRPLLTDFNRKALTQWENLKTARDKEDKPIELLEFRYNRCQSALPPSRHPTTGSYEWIVSPEKAEVAIAPTWLCELLVKFATEETEKKREQEERAIRWSEFQRSGELREGNVNLVDFLNFEVLPRLGVERVFNWPGHSFRQYGKTLKGCPPWRQSASGTSFHVWWDGSKWAWQDKAEGIGGNAIEYRWRLRGGHGTPKGKDFVDVVAELARDAGLTLPELPRNEAREQEKEKDWQEEYQIKVAEVQRKLHTLSYPADFTCDPHKKYLPSLKSVIPESGIVLLVAAKGSGKSHQINLIKQQWVGGYWEEKLIEEPQQLDLLGNPKPLRVERIWHEKTGKKFISINARIALGREQAIRWEFTWIEDADFEKSQEFNVDGEIIETATVLESISEIGLCWDSLSKLFDRDWSNTLVIIDEMELGLTHVSTSSTCRDRRSKILHTLESKLNECLNNGGLVIGADADLTDISYEYLTSIAPNHKPFIARHDYERPDEDKWLIEFHSGKKDEILSQIFEHLADEDCDPIVIATDNQAEAEALHNRLCKYYPYLAKDTNTIRIDSKITQSDFGKEFVKHPNEKTEQYKPKVLIHTSSLGVGCSIDIDHYKKVFGLFFGTLEPSQARQMLARVRRPVPRIVWAKERAGYAENDHTSYLPDIIKKQMFQYNQSTHDLIDTAVYLAKEKAKGIDNDAELLPHLIEVLQGMIGENGTWNNPHIDLVCRQKARRNYALSQLSLQLRRELIDEGHNLIDYEITANTSAGDAIKEEKEEIRLTKAYMIANSEDISIEEAQKINRKVQKTDEEEYQATKAFLKEELPGVELTQDFIYKAVVADNRRWLNQVKLFWMLQNPEATKDNDRKHWKYKLKQFSNSVACIHDVRTFSNKIEAINKSRLLDVIKLDDFETEYHDNDERLRDWFSDLLKRHRKNNFIKVAFGISITKDTQIIKLVNKLLGRIGIQLRKARKSASGINYYCLDRDTVLDSDRIAVLQSLTRKHEQQQVEQLAKEQQTLMQREQDAIAIQQLAELKIQAKAGQAIASSESTDNWLEEDEILSLSEWLASCETPEMLTDVRAIAPPAALKIAANRLPKEKREIIKQWVLAA